MDRYIQYGEIGHGSASIVYKGRKKGSIEYVAICSMDKARRARAENEAAVLRTLSHANVIRYHEYHVTTNHLWKVVEYCSGGDLATLIAQDERLPETTVRSFGRDLACGLQYIHSQGIVCCDIKPSNILVDGQIGRLLFSDFGLAMDVRGADDITRDAHTLHRLHTPSRSSHGRGAAGTSETPNRSAASPCYGAPELSARGGPLLSRASDVWALGCVIYEMTAGVPPFVSASLVELRAKIASAAADYPPELFAQPVRALLSSMLEKSASARPAWTALRTHAFWGSPALDALDTTVVDRHFARIANATKGAGPAPPSATASEFGAARNDPHCEDDDDDARPFTRESGSHVVMERVDTVDDDEDAGDADRADNDDMGGRDEDMGDENSGNDADEFVGGPEASPRKIVAWNDDVSAHLGSPAGLARATVVLARTPSAAPDLIFHPSDSAVEEIASTRVGAAGSGMSPAKIDKIIPVKAYTPMKLGKEAPADAQSHLAELVRAIDAATPRVAVACLAYLERLAMAEESANILANSHAANFLVVRLRPSQGAPPAWTAEVRARACRVLALCFRHATRLADGFEIPEAFSSLCDVVRSAGTVRDILRQALPALGELLFYCASVGTCTVGGPDSQPIEPPEIPSSALGAVVRRLADSDDEVLQLSALRTIANMAAVPGEHMRRICTGETALVVWKAFASTKNAEVKAASATALSRMVRFSVAIGQHIVDKVGTRSIASGLQDSGARVRQAFLNILNVLLKDSGDGGSLRRAQNLLLEDAAIVQGVLGALGPAGPNEVLRAKAMLAAGQMCRHSKDALLALCEGRLVHLMDKDARSLSAGMSNRPGSAHGARGAQDDGSFNLAVPPSPSVAGTDPYAARCLEFLLRTLARTAPTIMDSVRTGLASLAERRHATVAQAKTLRLALRHFPTVVHLMSSAVLRARMVDGLLLEDLTSLLSLVGQLSGPGDRMAPIGPRAWEECAEKVFAIGEAVCQHTSILMGHYSAIVQRLLPALATLLDCPEDTARLQASRMVACVVTAYAHLPALFDPTSDAPPVKASTRLLNQVLVKEILVRVPPLLTDKEPIPSVALRLLHSVLLRAPAYCSIFQRLGIVSAVAARMAESDGSVAVVGLMRLLLRAPPEDVDRCAVVDAGALRGLARILAGVARVSREGSAIVLQSAAGSAESLRDALVLVPQMLRCAQSAAEVSAEFAAAAMSASRELAEAALPRALEVLALNIRGDATQATLGASTPRTSRPGTARAADIALEDSAILARSCAEIVLLVARLHSDLHKDILGAAGQTALAHALNVSEDRELRAAVLSVVEIVCARSPHMARLLMENADGEESADNPLLAAVQARAGSR